MPEKLKDEPESMMKSKLVIHKGKEVVQGQEYKRLELVMTKNLGLKKLKLKSKTEVKKLNVTKIERRVVIKSLILSMINVVDVLAPTRKTFYLVWSAFSVPALDGSTKTVLRIVQ